MKCLKPPAMGRFGMEYNAVLMDEFETIVNKAKELIGPLVIKERAGHGWQFFIKDNWCSDNDTCDNEKCVKASIKDIRGAIGKSKHITKEEAYYDGDNERIITCCICGNPLNEFLTWNEIELDYLLEEKRRWSKAFFTNESFIIMAILNNTPSIDYDPSYYDTNQLLLGNKKPMAKALKERERFYNKIAVLCKRIICDLGGGVEV